MSNYLTSIAFWFIIILCTCKVFGDMIRKNHWLDGVEKQESPVYFLALCAIPIIRLITWVMIIAMAFVDKEDLGDV